MGGVHILVGTLVWLPLFHQELLCSFVYGKSSKTTLLLRHQQPASVLLRVEQSQDPLMTLPLTPEPGRHMAEQTQSRNFFFPHKVLGFGLEKKKKR